MLGTENSGDAKWVDLPGRGQESLHEDDTLGQWGLKNIRGRCPVGRGH